MHIKLNFRGIKNRKLSMNLGIAGVLSVILLTTIDLTIGLPLDTIISQVKLQIIDQSEIDNNRYRNIKMSNETKSKIHSNFAALLSAKEKSLNQTQSRHKRYVLQGSKWPTRNLTYKIIKYPKRLKKVEVDSEIAKAFNYWSEYSLLSFKQQPNGSVDIDISFDNIENGDPFDGPGKILSRSYYPMSGGDVYFDSAEYWTIGNRRGTNLFQAAAHEFGHALGLAHSGKNSSIMARFYKGYDPKFKIGKDDIFAIQKLYGKRKKIG